MQAERESEIASLRNLAKRMKQPNQPAVPENNDMDADDESTGTTPTSTSSTSSTSTPVTERTIRNIMDESLGRFMAQNPLFQAAQTPQTPKRRKGRNPYPNVGSVKANSELKQNELGKLQQEDQSAWKVCIHVI